MSRMWNELNYENQTEVMELIKKLAFEQQSHEVKEALVAALVELNMWSNSPCQEDE